MDNVKANKAIARRWIELWPAASLAVLQELGLDSAPGANGVRYALDANKAKEMKVSPNEFFARLAIVSAESDIASIGARPERGRAQGFRRIQHEGTIEVRITGPLNVGRNPHDMLARVVRRMYQGKRIGGIAGRELGVTTHATEITELRRDLEAPGRWVVIAATDFEYTEIG